MRRVEVIPYDENWPNLFQKEAYQLKNIFGESLTGIHHIGSTSVPQMIAKPVIDILIEVTDINRVDTVNEEMIKLLYVPKGENGIPNRRFFTKGGDVRTHHIHIFECGDSEINRHLLFRDYLMAHPDEAQAYSQLKQQLANKFPNNIDSYIAGKDAFIKGVDIKAHEWAYKNK